jgi:N-acetylneuraminic acid mutarotase
MLKLSNLLFAILLGTTAFSQTWQWSQLADMPFRTSNNAVCEAVVGIDEVVYTFGGIDTTKIYSGIHNRCFKYTVGTDTWIEIDTLPDAPKIASAASFVKGKIYILGGYHVAAGGSETSSNKVHVYNPGTESFEADGASIPVPIDDHVQCVYQDSLIFVVTGWSNSGNVPNVQIYNPLLNQWQVGTSTTNNAFYTAFGASGYIIGDTIYYHGGASGGAFGAKKFMRKGYINPLDPTEITWTLMDDAPGDAGYRSACSAHGNTIFWIGGSAKSYNYDGIAYDGSGGVDPSARVLHFNNSVYQYSDEIAEPYGVMDLRGVAKFGNDRWIICGGMDTNQVVSNRTFLLTSNSVGLESIEGENLLVKYQGEKIIIETSFSAEGMLIDPSGRVVDEFQKASFFTLNRVNYTPGIYIFVQGNSSIRIRL